MNNKVLNEIKEFAISKLMANGGFCGVMDGEELIMLNSDDGNGKDIIIKITLKDE